jgi:oligoribonuclease NrnB/cAMP/cGMP phosphodiesterase (DHH superfamily)
MLSEWHAISGVNRARFILKWFNKFKSKTFRKLINIADRVDIWFKTHYNINPKQIALEQTQDRIPLSKLDDTIGTALGIKKSNER